MKRMMRTLIRCFQRKEGFLLFCGMLLGLGLALVGSSGLIAQKSATMVTMLGAIVSMVCGNGFARVITILQQIDEEE